MVLKKLDELFNKIKEITQVEEIGFHKAEDGKIIPMYKTNMGELSIEKWQSVHKNNPVYIKNDPILQEVFSTKKTVVVSNTKEDSRKSDVVLSFNINSIMVIPVVYSNEVIGMVPIVSIGKPHDFTEDEVQMCESLVNEYLQYFI